MKFVANEKHGEVTALLERSGRTDEDAHVEIADAVASFALELAT